MLQITSSIRDMVERALVEDLGHGDVTTDALISAGRARAGVGGGQGRWRGGRCLEVALEVFRQVDPSTQ